MPREIEPIEELLRLYERRAAADVLDGHLETRIKMLEGGFEFRVNAYEGIEGPLDHAAAKANVEERVAAGDEPRPPRLEFREVGSWTEVPSS